jgi:formylglycine-generating enzyme required for sulfatase activity
MHGNVWEWCHDYYGLNHYTQSPERVCRGEAVGSSADYIRSARREGLNLDFRSPYSGFRLVREMD